MAWSGHRAQALQSRSLLVVVLGCLLAPAAARADPFGARLAWVRGEGADRCPDETVIRQAVINRIGPDAFRGAVTQRIEAVVSGEAGQWRLRLYVRDAQGARLGQRELVDSGATCDEIAATGALAIALSIDPDAPLTPRSPPPPTPAAAAVPVAPARVERVIVREGAPFGGLDASLRMVGLAAALPQISPGVGLGVQVVRRERFSLETSVLVVPAVHVDADDARFGFGLTALGLSGCGAITRARAARLSICGGLLGGVVHATVSGSERPQPADVPWLALSLGARLSVPIAGPLAAEFALDALTPLSRLRFVGAQQDAVVFEQPLLGAVGSFGLGLTFR